MRRIRARRRRAHLEKQIRTGTKRISRFCKKHNFDFEEEISKFYDELNVSPEEVELILQKKPIEDIKHFADKVESNEEPITEEKPEEPVVEEKPEEPVVEEKPEEPVVEEKPEEPVSEEKPEEPIAEEKSEKKKPATKKKVTTSRRKKATTTKKATTKKVEK